jgi:hypothetical protein
MAQDTFVNVTADKNSATKVDGSDHRHSPSIGGSASGDFSISYDKAVVTRLATLDSLYASARKQASSSGLK